MKSPGHSLDPASRSASELEHHACEAAPVYTRHVKSGAAPPGSSCAMKAGPLSAVQHKHAPSAKGKTRNARVRSQPATDWRGVHVPHHQGQHRHPLTALVRCLLPCCPLGARLPLPETDIFSPQETAMLASTLATPGPRLERSDGSMPPLHNGRSGRQRAYSHLLESPFVDWTHPNRSTRRTEAV